MIGGGIGGLSTALLLGKRGYRVRVLEQGANVGGAFASFVRDGFRFDTGFHYAGGIEQDLQPVLKELGLDDLPWHALDRDGFDHVWYDGREYRIGADSPLDDEDETMHQVLAGNAMTMHLGPDLPRWVFEEIEGSMRQGAYRLRGGCEQLVKRLVEGIEATGGEVVTGCRVKKISDIGKDALVVSSLHPRATMALLDEGEVRPVYRRRLNQLPSTRGMFTLHLLLRPGSVRYRNYNDFVYPGRPDLWQGEQTSGVMVHYYVPEKGLYTPAIDLLQPMEWSQVAGYRDDREAYHRFKREKAAELIALARQAVPELEDAIVGSWSSSPLTWERYTGAWEGCAFGALKSTLLPDEGRLSPRTPVEGLYLTGQSLAIHGLKGTLYSALQTADAIITNYE